MTIANWNVLLDESDKVALTEAAQAIPDDGYIVEWGMGGSTLIFADQLKPQQHLISIEHNREWFEKVQTSLANHPAHDRIHMVFVLPELPLYVYAFAQPQEEMPAGCKYYIDPTRIVGAMPHPFDWHRASFVLVDGIARGPVLASLRSKLLSNTPVYLHDYVGREMWYDWAVNLYDIDARVGVLLKLRVP